MKKIAFIASSVCSFGGEQRVTTMIANELADRYGYDITLFTWDKPEDKEKGAFYLSEKLKLHYFCAETGFLDWNIRRVFRVFNRKTGILNHRAFAKFMCDMYYPPRKRRELIEELNRNQFDFVIGVSGYNSILLGLIVDQITAKTIGWQHNSYEAYFETKGLYYWNQFYMFEYTVKKLDACFVLNSYIASRYKESFGVDCNVFYNPRSFASKEKARLEQPLFIACGEFNYRKGFDYLIEAYHSYVEKCKEVSPENIWKLVMLGDGKMRQEIESKIAEYHLEEYVQLKGNVKNVQQYMLQASCFVLSSRWEGFPMVGTEALEMGLPTIAFDITAMQPMVTDGVEGLLVKAYDCNAFADAMLRMSTEDEMRRMMGINAVKKSREFSMESIIRQWVDTLEKIAR